jgi:hypothetical protein
MTRSQYVDIVGAILGAAYAEKTGQDLLWGATLGIIAADMASIAIGGALYAAANGRS